MKVLVHILVLFALHHHYPNLPWYCLLIGKGYRKSINLYWGPLQKKKLSYSVQSCFIDCYCFKYNNVSCQLESIQDITASGSARSNVTPLVQFIGCYFNPTSGRLISITEHPPNLVRQAVDLDIYYDGRVLYFEFRVYLFTIISSLMQHMQIELDGLLKNTKIVLSAQYKYFCRQKISKIFKKLFAFF